MNMNLVRAVWKRDLTSWFGNPTGYVFIILFVLACCFALLFGENGAFFTNNLANLDALNARWFPIIAIAFVSAATMNVWASERSNGTQELLFTLPGQDADLQLGKYLAALSVFTVSLAFTLVMPIALMLLGDPDWGQLFANYVGYWLLGAMLVSVSMVGSQLTQNGTVALIFSTVLCAFAVYLGDVLGWLGWLSWQSNGPTGQFALFAGGEIPFSGVLLFVGLAVAFFYLGLALLGRRAWRSGGEWLHGTLRFAGLAVCAGALTVIGVQALPRVDATVEGIHSLSAETERLLADLDDQRPVNITAYVSEQVPEQFVQQKKLLLNLLDQFDSLGGAAVNKQVIMPEPYSPDARRAEDEFGIRPVPVGMQLPGGGIAEVQMFLGFAVQSGTNEVVTPFVGPAAPIEYELMRSVRTVASGGGKKVGILKTDVELAGGFDMQTFQQKPRWAIAQELGQQYEIENVDPASDYPTDIECLIVPQPSSLEQEPMDRLQQWILSGKPTLLFEDPMPLSANGTAADDPKGGMQARMMGGGGPQKGNWAGFLAAIGVDAPVGQVVWDQSSRTFPQPGMPLEYVLVRSGGLAADSAITSGLQSMITLFAGSVSKAVDAGVEFQPLIHSLPLAGISAGNGVVAKTELFQPNFLGQPQPNPYPRREPRNEDLVLAARVTGKPVADAESSVNLIYVADLDMISDIFFQLRSSRNDANLRFDNVTFALNCIDTLSGDESLIALRKRRPILRKLTVVEAAQQEFEQRWLQQKQAAEQAAASSLDQAQQRLDDAVAAIRKDESLDAQAREVKIVEVQQNERRKFELEEAQIESEKKRSIEQAEYDRDAARLGIYNSYRTVMLLLAALPGLLLGMLTWVRRSSRAAAIVPQNRQVKGAN